LFGNEYPHCNSDADTNWHTDRKSNGHANGHSDSDTNSNAD
jgi:hypothetical protein